MADPDQVARSMWTLFEPVHVAQACAAAIPYPSPIGVPAPGTVT